MMTSDDHHFLEPLTSDIRSWIEAQATGRSPSLPSPLPAIWPATVRPLLSEHLEWLGKNADHAETRALLAAYADGESGDRARIHAGLDEQRHSRAMRDLAKVLDRCHREYLEMTSTPFSLARIRCHGWHGPTLRRAVLALSSAEGADRPLADELLRWLLAASAPDPSTKEGWRIWQRTLADALNALGPRWEPAVSPELEPVAAILAGPAPERLPQLRARYGDPLPVLKAVVDELGPTPTMPHEFVSPVHEAAMEVLAELGSIEAVRLLIGALPWDDQFERPAGVISILARMDLGAMLDGFLAAWPTLEPEWRHQLWRVLLSRVQDGRELDDERVFALLDAELRGPDFDTVIDYPGLYRDARGIPLLFAFVERCITHGTNGFLARHALCQLEHYFQVRPSEGLLRAVQALPAAYRDSGAA